jgi:hypothetical protein
MLQRTRVWILGKDGFTVDLAETSGEVETCLTAKAYRLLVICHSLAREEQAAGTSLAAALQPGIKLLAIGRSEHAADRDSPLADILHINSRPERLRACVRMLMTAAHT